MPSHSEGPGTWFSVWRFLWNHCLYERAAKVLTRLRGCAGSPEPSLLAYAISTKFAWCSPILTHRLLDFKYPSPRWDIVSSFACVSHFLWFHVLLHFLLVSEVGCDLWLWHSLEIVSLFSWLHMNLCMAKPTKWHVRPAKTQMSLGIRPVWSESSLCAQLKGKDPRFLHADSEDWSDWADA